MRRRCAGDAQEMRILAFIDGAQEFRRRCAGDAQELRTFALFCNFQITRHFQPLFPKISALFLCYFSLKL